MDGQDWKSPTTTVVKLVSNIISVGQTDLGLNIRMNNVNVVKLNNL